MTASSLVYLPPAVAFFTAWISGRSAARATAPTAKETRRPARSRRTEPQRTQVLMYVLRKGWGEDRENRCRGSHPARFGHRGIIPCPLLHCKGNVGKRGPGAAQVKAFRRCHFLADGLVLLDPLPHLLDGQPVTELAVVIPL